ncbi:hypothetical protein [Corynebacterium aurimucosum]|uniref:hypothetical protein n=1 Tax=Corynebacterium aurimucosum TaxID=169292 RepID=UPI001879A980|nr:hypothetical protein [Corynebacterium aurimucosum]MBE7338095.1 hypothetical protein [Corynebacterium aurimucosum]
MGVLMFGPLSDVAFGVSDEVVASVAEAARQGLHKGMFVSLSGIDGDNGGYLQVDVSLFVPEVRGEKGENLVDDTHAMWIKPVTTGDVEFPVDDMLVEQLLEVMEETDGCIVFDSEDNPVLLPQRAKAMLTNARRINLYEDIIFPTPGH